MKIHPLLTSVALATVFFASNAKAFAETTMTPPSPLVEPAKALCTNVQDEVFLKNHILKWPLPYSQRQGELEGKVKKGTFRDAKALQAALTEDDRCSNLVWAHAKQPKSSKPKLEVPIGQFTVAFFFVKKGNEYLLTSLAL